MQSPSSKQMLPVAAGAAPEAVVFRVVVALPDLEQDLSRVSIVGDDFEIASVRSCKTSIPEEELAGTLGALAATREEAVKVIEADALGRDKAGEDGGEDNGDTHIDSWR